RIGCVGDLYRFPTRIEIERWARGRRPGAEVEPGFPVAIRRDRGTADAADDEIYRLVDRPLFDAEPEAAAVGDAAELGATGDVRIVAGTEQWYRERGPRPNAECISGPRYHHRQQCECESPLPVTHGAPPVHFGRSHLGSGFRHRCHET